MFNKNVSTTEKTKESNNYNQGHFRGNWGGMG